MAYLAFTCVGGPEAHMAQYQQVLVRRHGFITQQELLELYSLSQLLPGPTSTQTLMAIGYRVGGLHVAVLTLLLWLTPACLLMTLFALAFIAGQQSATPREFTEFMHPIVIGLVAQAAYALGVKVINSRTQATIMVVSALLVFNLPSPYLTPLVIAAAGLYTAIRKRQSMPREELQPLRIDYTNLLVFFGILVAAALVGNLTQYRPMLLFENFYRNGSLIFGGGQVLVPLMYTEFVDFKHYLTQQEFLAGYGMSQVLPGPVFSFCGFVGALAMRNYGLGGSLLGGLIGSIGIFLPGSLLMLFVVRFWDRLKRHREVRASLLGFNAAACGLLVAAMLLMFRQMENTQLNFSLVTATIGLIHFGKVPPYLLILAGLLAGFVF